MPARLQNTFGPTFLCLPTPKNTAHMPMIVFFDDPMAWKTVRGVFETPSGAKGEMSIRVRFAETSQPWQSVIG